MYSKSSNNEQHAFQNPVHYWNLFAIRDVHTKLSNSTINTHLWNCNISLQLETKYKDVFRFKIVYFKVITIVKLLYYNLRTISDKGTYTTQTINSLLVLSLLIRTDNVLEYMSSWVSESMFVIPGFNVYCIVLVLSSIRNKIDQTV